MSNSSYFIFIPLIINDNNNYFMIFNMLIKTVGQAVAQLVEALCTRTSQKVVSLNRNEVNWIFSIYQILPAALWPWS
jgi:hypothetical protein